MMSDHNNRGILALSSYGVLRTPRHFLCGAMPPLKLGNIVIIGRQDEGPESEDRRLRNRSPLYEVVLISLHCAWPGPRSTVNLFEDMLRSIYNLGRRQEGDSVN